VKNKNVPPLTIYCHFCVSQELRRLKEKYEMLAVELEKTKADNVQLYGKIRYVQDYSNEKIVSRGPKKV
jgi:homeobox protein cut-like